MALQLVIPVQESPLGVELQYAYARIATSNVVRRDGIADHKFQVRIQVDIYPVKPQANTSIRKLMTKSYIEWVDVIGGTSDLLTNVYAWLKTQAPFTNAIDV